MSTRIQRLVNEGRHPEYRETLKPTLERQTQKIKAGQLGEAGPWICIENLTDQEAVVRLTVGE